jgi:hypothetical protein
LFRDTKQMLFGVRVERRRARDQRGFLRRQLSGPHRGVGGRQPVELPRRRDRSTHRAATDAEQPTNRRAAVVATQLGNPPGGLAEHPLDHPRDRTQLIHDPRRRFERKRAASKSAATEFNELRVVSSDANMCSYRSRVVRQEARKAPISKDFFNIPTRATRPRTATGKPPTPKSPPSPQLKPPLTYLLT